VHFRRRKRSRCTLGGGRGAGETSEGGRGAGETLEGGRGAGALSEEEEEQVKRQREEEEQVKRQREEEEQVHFRGVSLHTAPLRRQTGPTGTSSAHVCLMFP